MNDTPLPPQREHDDDQQHLQHTSRKDSGTPRYTTMMMMRQTLSRLRPSGLAIQNKLTTAATTTTSSRAYFCCYGPCPHNPARSYSSLSSAASSSSSTARSTRLPSSQAELSRCWARQPERALMRAVEAAARTVDVDTVHTCRYGRVTSSTTHSIQTRVNVKR